MLVEAEFKAILNKTSASCSLVNEVGAAFRFLWQLMSELHVYRIHAQMMNKIYPDVPVWKISITKTLTKI
jgi:hypothetical protein